MQQITTKFGIATLNNRGYYKISSRKEGNNGKLLHRLIYEDYYGVSLLPSVVIHHKDGNKTNNDISNLEAMFHSKHSSYHSVGENNGMFGKKHSEKSREKMSKNNKRPMLKKKHSDETRRKMRENHQDYSNGKHPFCGKHHKKETILARSKAETSTGYFRVHKHRCNTCKNGIIYKYKYYDENNKRKAIASTSIERLKHKVLEKGFEWIEYTGGGEVIAEN